MGKFCRLATLIFGLAWIWWKALHSSQSTWCMCSRASSSPELCTYSADPIDKTAPRNVDVKLVCAQMLPRLRKNFFGHAGALARNICEKLVTLCVCQFHIGKATQEFIELFLQFRALRTTVFNKYRMSCRTCSKHHRRNDPYRMWRTQKFQFMSHVPSQSQESRLMLPPPQRNLTLIGLAVTLGSFGNPFCFVLTRHSIIAKMCWSKPGGSSKSLPFCRDFRSLPKHRLDSYWDLMIWKKPAFTNTPLHIPGETLAFLRVKLN